MSSSNRLALRLTLPGAPNREHTIFGITGVYRPDRAVPLEEAGVTEKEAKEAIRAGAPLEIVDLEEKTVDLKDKPKSAATGGKKEES